MTCKRSVLVASSSRILACLFLAVGVLFATALPAQAEPIEICRPCVDEVVEEGENWVLTVRTYVWATRDEATGAVNVIKTELLATLYQTLDLVPSPSEITGSVPPVIVLTQSAQLTMHEASAAGGYSADAQTTAQLSTPDISGACNLQASVATDESLDLWSLAHYPPFSQDVPDNANDEAENCGSTSTATHAEGWVGAIYAEASSKHLTVARDIQYRTCSSCEWTAATPSSQQIEMRCDATDSYDTDAPSGDCDVILPAP